MHRNARAFLACTRLRAGETAEGLKAFLGTLARTSRRRRRRTERSTGPRRSWPRTARRNAAIWRAPWPALSTQSRSGARPRPPSKSRPFEASPLPRCRQWPEPALGHRLYPTGDLGRPGQSNRPLASPAWGPRPRYGCPTEASPPLPPSGAASSSDYRDGGPVAQASTHEPEVVSAPATGTNLAVWATLTAVVCGLAVAGIRVGAVVTHHPVIGYANNYDMLRLSACLGAWPHYPDGKEVTESNFEAPGSGVRDRRRPPGGELLLVLRAPLRRGGGTRCPPRRRRAGHRRARPHGCPGWWGTSGRLPFFSCWSG